MKTQVENNLGPKHWTVAAKTIKISKQANKSESPLGLGDREEKEERAGGGGNKEEAFLMLEVVSGAWTNSTSHELVIQLISFTVPFSSAVGIPFPAPAFKPE